MIVSCFHTVLWKCSLLKRSEWYYKLKLYIRKWPNSYLSHAFGHQNHRTIPASRTPIDSHWSLKRNIPRSSKDQKDRGTIRFRESSSRRHERSSSGHDVRHSELKQQSQRTSWKTRVSVHAAIITCEHRYTGGTLPVALRTITNRVRGIFGPSAWVYEGTHCRSSTITRHTAPFHKIYDQPGQTARLFQRIAEKMDGKPRAEL